MSEQLLTAILGELQKLNAKQAAPVVSIEQDALTREEVGKMTGHSGYWGLYSWSEKWNLKPFARGRYRRSDVLAAIARAAMAKGNTARVKRRTTIKAA